MPKISSARNSSARKKSLVDQETGKARDQILDAAEEISANHGYDGTSIRSIAEATGANLGIFHF